MAPHSSTVAWQIPWTEEPGGLQSMGLLGVRHDWATSLFTFMHWRRKWQPTPVFLSGESKGRGSLVGCHGVAQSRTRLKRLSRSSSHLFSGRCDRIEWIQWHWQLQCHPSQNRAFLRYYSILLSFPFQWVSLSSDTIFCAMWLEVKWLTGNVFLGLCSNRSLSSVISSLKMFNFCL